MAIITQDGGQSSSALGGQTITYVMQMVQQQLAGAPSTMIQSHLLRVLNDFYTRSTAWRAYVGNYPVNKGQALVQLNPVDQNSRIQFVLYAFLFPFQGSNDPLFLKTSPRQLYGFVPAQPSIYYMQFPDQLVMYPTPDQTYGPILNVYASLVPTTLAAILPDMSFTQHADALIWGTLARMYQIPKRPWSDKELAMEYEKKYRREILIYRDIANRGYSTAAAPMAFPPFAGRSSSQVLPRASG